MRVPEESQSLAPGEGCLGSGGSGRQLLLLHISDFIRAAAAHAALWVPGIPVCKRRGNLSVQRHPGLR